MSALESPFEKWGMPKPGVTAAQIAAWFAAQPDFHDHAPDYVGSAISAQDDWAQGDSRNGAMVGIYQEVEARLRVARGGRKPRFALVPPGTISRCGLSSSHKTSAHGFDGYKGHVAIDPARPPSATGRPSTTPSVPTNPSATSPPPSTWHPWGSMCNGGAGRVHALARVSRLGLS
jgi:hypothetical protein